LQATGGAALTTSENPPETLDIEPAIPPSGDPGRRRSRALLYFGVIAPVVVGIDQLVKHLTVTNLADREPMRLLGGALYLVHVRNSGAAFSLGQGYTFVFPLVTLVVVAWIGWMVRSLASTPWAVALGLVLGGALGNFIDRLFRAPGPFVGHVVDMFSVFDNAGRVFPVFNVADSALCCGVVLAILLELTGRRRDGTRVVDEHR
jgi:signal peptidase II